jgi:hypothetical protein
MILGGNSPEVPVVLVVGGLRQRGDVQERLVGCSYIVLLLKYTHLHQSTRKRTTSTAAGLTLGGDSPEVPVVLVTSPEAVRRCPGTTHVRSSSESV